MNLIAYIIVSSVAFGFCVGKATDSVWFGAAAYVALMTVAVVQVYTSPPPS